MTTVHLAIHDYPDLSIGAFVARYHAPLGSVASPPGLTALLRADTDTPFQPDETLRTDIRNLLRHAGYKPTGRGKPASEYLGRAAADGSLTPINAAVDACNATSLHTGFPISVIDLNRASPPLHIAPAAPDHRYVFNTAGQEIAVAGLLCLHDADGPCANPVKDAQRTKTTPTTTTTLSIVWGTTRHPARLTQALIWYHSLVSPLASLTPITP